MNSPKDIRNELLSAFLALDELYRNSPTTTTPDLRVAYLDLELSEHLLNAIKALEYHYRDDVPEMRTKRKWGAEMVRAHKLLKKYSSESDEYVKLKLKRTFDESGYLESKDFLSDAKENREKLKRKL